MLELSFTGNEMLQRNSLMTYFRICLVNTGKYGVSPENLGMYIFVQQIKSFFIKMPRLANFGSHLVVLWGGQEVDQDYGSVLHGVLFFHGAQVGMFAASLWLG